MAYKRRRKAAKAWGVSMQRMMNVMTGVGTQMVNNMMTSALKTARRQVASAMSASAALAGSGNALRTRRAESRPPAQAKPGTKTPARAPALPPASRARSSTSRIKPREPHLGRAVSTGGVRRFELWVPPGTRARQRLPLVVMLHGCSQDIESFRGSTRMNRIADKAGFCVLYLEQERLANPMNCWNWFALDSGKAQSEIAIIRAAIRQVCRKYPVNPDAVALVGLSAGASMAALVASRHPAEFVAVAMHAGVPPGSARRVSSALAAMQGEGSPAVLHRDEEAGLPALLVVQGMADKVVDPVNGEDAARQWANACEAHATPRRVSQRGNRYPVTITDYVAEGRVRARLCQVKKLGHAWSGGDGRFKYSDPEGPDASLMTWRFIEDVLRQRAPAKPTPRRRKTDPAPLTLTLAP